MKRSLEQFTDPHYARIWKPYPHWHVIESNYGDVTDGCYPTERGALRVLTRHVTQGLVDADFERQPTGDYYVWEPGERATDPNAEPLILGLLLCECDEDCFMIEEVSAAPIAGGPE